MFEGWWTPSIMWLPYISAFTMGLLGGAHCVGMCGGIVAALGFSVPNVSLYSRMRILLAYNVGRIASYGAIGAAFGLLGQQVALSGGVSVMRIIAGLLLIAMGLYIADWWRGLTYLERVGNYLWRYIQPLGNRFLPARNARSAILLGAIWGWLPCGLVYSALAYALSQADGVRAAGVMVAFGVGTLPAVLGSGFFAERLKTILQARELRIWMGILLMLFGGWTVGLALKHANHSEHAAMNEGHMLQDETDSMHHHHH